MRKCNQQCNLDKFHIGESEGFRCFECNKTFVEAELDNPTIKLLKDYEERKQDDYQDIKRT